MLFRSGPCAWPVEELGGWTGEIRIIMAGDRDWDELTCVAGARIWCGQMRRPTGRIQLDLGGVGVGEGVGRLPLLEMGQLRAKVGAVRGCGED